MPKRRHGYHWHLARTLLERGLKDSFGQSVHFELGRLNKIGEGLSWRVFATHVDFSPDTALSGAYSVAIPNFHADSELAKRIAVEKEILDILSRRNMRFQVPKIIALVETESGNAVVRRCLEGMSLASLKGTPFYETHPRWETIGKIAAQIHQLDPSELVDILPTCGSRRKHGLEALRALEGLTHPITIEAAAWARAHLPPDGPVRLLHGDLLEQNVLIPLGQLLGIIDWEYSRLGDPAYDLAIATRGKKRPFQQSNGLEMLLETYLKNGGSHVTKSDIHFHELCIAAKQYRDALRGVEGMEPPEQALERLSGILKRAQVL